jgi:predicted nucleotidyltransferase
VTTVDTTLWEQVVDAVPGTPALVALTGSHAYGTNHPDSDVDFRGFYVAPTEAFFNLQPPQESVDRTLPDVTLYELRKFVKLAVGANPTILEVLWTDPVHSTDVGDLFRAHRRVFLSKKVLKSYGGYAMQQLQKARNGTGGSRGQAHLRREKFKLHTYRLMLAGIHVLETGDLQVRVDDPEALWAKARQPLEAIEREFGALDDRMRRAATSSKLPDEPDYAAVNELLRQVRLAYLSS